ncbi:hypothetical protein, partial [Pseudomonas aeruginosa]|uniref:hypothetical protein n=1 Tax=Pseudomonas aeruginosa TaxID=287 RepID=UPI001A7EF2A0
AYSMNSGVMFEARDYFLCFPILKRCFVDADDLANSIGNVADHSGLQGGDTMSPHAVIGVSLRRHS